MTLIILDDAWNFADADNCDGTFDVYFDWLARERRMAVVEAATAEEAYEAVMLDKDGCINDSRLVAVFDHPDEEPDRR